VHTESFTFNHLTDTVIPKRFTNGNFKKQLSCLTD